MVWRAEDPQGNEAGKIKHDIVFYTRGKGLDLGCGPYKAWPHFIGVDNCADTKLYNIPIKPDMPVETCERLDLIGSETVDFVFSSHLLEHIQDFKAALAEWWRVIKAGGHLCLYLPHKDYYPNIGQPGSNPDHKHDFVPLDIVTAMQDIATQSGAGWDLVENEERNEGMEYSFFLVFKKRDDQACMRKANRWKVAGRKTACVVRYGGFGDMLQAASVAPGLRALGYKVIFMTQPRGRDVLEHDPNIDEFLVQDKDQVPNEELGAFWRHWSGKFDKWINLSESVEATWLAHPNRMAHRWPKAVRDKYLNANYLEFAHDVAEVEYVPHVKYYPSQAERNFAANFISAEEFLILWALSGSSVHKAWPYLDQAIAQILLAMPDAKIVLTGDAACKLLESGWEQEPRVVMTSGEWTIGQTLSVAQFSNCVIGPETGVLNAVAFNQHVRKIIMLSHSSVENLCRDWVKTTALMADVPCYPCHQMHYDRTFCPEHVISLKDAEWAKDEGLVKQMTDSGHIDGQGMFKTGAALCAGSIPASEVVESVRAEYETWRANRKISA